MSKQQDVKHKESAILNQAVGEMTSDMDFPKFELSAVVQYFAKSNEMEYTERGIAHPPLRSLDPRKF